MERSRIVSLAAVALIVSAGAVAQPAGRGMRGPLLDDLKLSDQQKSQFESLRTDHMKTMIAHRAKVASARVDLRSLMKADNVDRGAVEKKLKEVAALGVDGGLMRLDHWSAVNKILTPEQQKIWKEHRAQAGPGRGMRGNRGIRGGRRFDGDRMMHERQMMQRRDRMDD